MSPRLAKLTQEFLEDGGTFEKFKIGDLFDEPQSGDVDIQNSDINGRGCMFINSGITNLGIKGYTDRIARIFPANSITIDFFGNAYYRSEPYKLATHNHVFSFSGGVLSDEAVGLYIVAAMSYLPKVYSYGNMATKPTLKNNHIILPSISKGKLAFDFMRRYIATLKAERVATLKAYLQAAGISDTILTESELAALAALRQNRIESKPVLLKKIFRIEKGKRLTKAQMLPGSLNYIGAISTNNGIRQKIHSGKIWEPNCITVNYNGSVGYSFYQEEPFHASDDVNVLYLNDTRLNRNRALFFCSILFKVSRKFSYSEKWTKERMENTTINIPMGISGSIDWDFIENMISAQIKLAIKDLMNNKDLEIATTEKITQRSYISDIDASILVESTQAAEPFEIYQWNIFPTNEVNMGLANKTILIGCYRDKKHLEWILSNHLYNIRLGGRKGSACDQSDFFANVVRLYLYNLKDNSKIYVYEIIGNQKMSGKELNEMGYPRKSPGKEYMVFSIGDECSFSQYPLNIAETLSSLSNHINGAPVFIEPY